MKVLSVRSHITLPSSTWILNSDLSPILLSFNVVTALYTYWTCGCFQCNVTVIVSVNIIALSVTKYKICFAASISKTASCVILSIALHFARKTYSANSAFIFLLNTVYGKVIDTGVSVHLLDSNRDLRPNVCWKFTQREFRGRLCIRSQRASSKFVFKFETAQILRYKFRRNLWKCRNASSYRLSTKVMKGEVMLLVKWKEHICGLYKQKRLYKLSNCYNFNTSCANIIHLC